MVRAQGEEARASTSQGQVIMLRIVPRVADGHCNPTTAPINQMPADEIDAVTEEACPSTQVKLIRRGSRPAYESL